MTATAPPDQLRDALDAVFAAGAIARRPRRGMTVPKWAALVAEDAEFLGFPDAARWISSHPEATLRAAEQESPHA